MLSMPSKNAPRKMKAEAAPTKQRRALMARVRQRGTAPELAVRRVLSKLRRTYKLNLKALPGSPDIVLLRSRTAIFVHGCFWHRHRQCVKSTTPKTRATFWKRKFAQNVERDRVKFALLKKMGWKAVIVWECQTRDIDSLKERIKRALSAP